MTGVLCTVYGAQVYFKMPNLAINCERLVPKSAWRFGRNAHESEAAEDNCRWSWIQTQRQILLNVHLVGPARGTSNRITPAQLLIRRRIFSSATYISSDMQEELLTESRQRSYWIDGGSRLHPQTSRRTWIDGGSRLHPHTSRRTCNRRRGTSNRIMPAELLNRLRISSSASYNSTDLQEELLTGSCQRSYWTDRGSHLHPHTSRRTSKRNF